MTPEKPDLKTLYDLIEDIETTMFTTRRRDGYLVSRPMANQKHAPGADLWFVGDEGSEKMDELTHDPHVCLAYYKDRTREWVSVSGVATLSRDRATIDALWAPDWKAWFDGPDDPKITLIAVEAHSAVYLKVDKPQPVILFELVKGMITGSRPDFGDVRKVSRSQLERGDA
jgi:general stress protein 26